MSKHTIVHLEIPAHDPKAASSFYGELFGWNMVKNEQFDYYMFQIVPNEAGGGFTQVQEGSNEYGRNPGQVLVYVDTDNVDESLSKAEALGAKTVVPKMEIPGSGWLAVFVDPAGNHIGLWQTLTH